MTKKQTRRISTKKAIATFEKAGGTLRTSDALKLGIHPVTLYYMRDVGMIEVVSRGVYRIAGLPPLGNSDLVIVASRTPNCVICLISALSYHELTTQIPHRVHIALAKGAEEPRITHPPIQTYRFSDAAFTEGIETHNLDGVPVRVYCPEKTIADCFKFRNKIGLDIVLEAVRAYRDTGRMNTDMIMHFAKICRVSRIVRPYIEAML